MIHIFSEPQDGMRLKSYGSVTKGEKSTLRIEIEVDDPRELGYLLRNLQQLAQAQKAMAKPARRAKLLALPPPDGFGQ